MERPQNKSWLWWNMANIVSSVRLLAPLIFFILPMVYPMSMTMIISIYAGLVLTDALDGILARLIGNVSGIGKIIDIIADKILHLCGFAYLLSAGIFDALLSTLAVIVVIQEIRIARLMFEAISLVAEKSFREIANVSWKEKYAHAYSRVTSDMIEKFNVHDYGKWKMIFYGIGMYFFIWNYFTPHVVNYVSAVFFLFAGIGFSVVALRKYKFDFESWKSKFFSNI